MLKDYKNTRKTKTFLGLMKKFRLVDNNIITHARSKSIHSLQFNTFKKTYVSLLNITYIFEFLNLHVSTKLATYNGIVSRVIYFYAKLSKLKKNDNFYKLTPNLFHTYANSNVVVFSKPAKQLFLIFFKNKPIFVFTSGLMRIVMNEKRKSSKKLYKVSISLIKLALILLTKKNYFDSCYVKLKNVGQLRSKILMTFNKHKIHNIINYVFFKLTYDTHAQKFKTRRSIKKYVKKRFKLNN